MKYKYVESIINGQRRITEMTTVLDNIIDASLTYVNIVDEFGRQIYQLSNGEPVYVGPLAFQDSKEKNRAILKKLKETNSIEEIIIMLCECIDVLINGGSISQDTRDFINNYKNIKKDLK